MATESSPQAKDHPPDLKETPRRGVIFHLTTRGPRRNVDVAHVVSRKSSLYGAIGIALALLLWTYFAGRLLTVSIATNATLWKRRRVETGGHGRLGAEAHDGTPLNVPEVLSLEWSRWSSNAFLRSRADQYVPLVGPNPGCPSC